MGFVKGREVQSLGSHTQNNGMNLTLRCSIGWKSCLCFHFSANSNACSVKLRGFKTMFLGHGEPKGRYLWSVRETSGVSPLEKGFFVVAVNCCVYSRNRCIFLRILILLIKGPVHGENCVNMIVVKSYFLVLFWTSFFMYFCMLYIFWDCNYFWDFYSKQPLYSWELISLKHILRNCKS
jgi:hypothetical protein